MPAALQLLYRGRCLILDVSYRSIGDVKLMAEPAVASAI